MTTPEEPGCHEPVEEEAMSEHQETLEQPTPRDYRRAGAFILLAALIQAMIAYAFYDVHDQAHLRAAILFLLIAIVDLFVGTMVLVFADKGGKPTAS